jgi:hypothetical protein
MTKTRNLSFHWARFNWPFVAFWTAYIGTLVFSLGYVAFT